MMSSKNMIPLKDMHFRIQMQLSPEQEEKAKQDLMELACRISGESPRSPGPGIGYSVEIMSIPEAFEWFQALKLAFDKEQALSKA
jgi:hypothetical protein